MVDDRIKFIAKNIHRVIQRFLSGLLAAILISSCGNYLTQNNTHSPDTLPTASSSTVTRIVKHALGEVEVPVNPQRIITISPCTFESVLSLGIEPIGGSHWNWKQPYLQGKIEDVSDVGWIPNPSLEKILALNPDLILGTVFNQPIYQQLSQIAPTFLAVERPEGSQDWKQVFDQVADAVGKTQTAKQVMADYYARLEEFKQQMGDRFEGMQISVAALYQGEIGLYSKRTFSGTVLDDAGLSRPPSQERERGSTLGGDSYTISKERFRDLDGDALFLIDNANNSANQKTLQQLSTDPLWAKLNVVEQGKVFIVQDYWLSCSPLAANAIIDDLFKYLVEGQ